MQPARSVVLVVDDDLVVRDYLCELLAHEGYAVESAADGAAGLARIAAGGVDLVLLDMILPALDGIELCRQVRARESDVYLPIIMLTGLDDEANRRAGFAAGADDYVTKPFRQADLLARVQVWVQTHRRLQASHERLRAEQEVSTRLASEAEHALTVMREAHARLLAANTREQRLLRETEAQARVFRGLHEVAVAAGGVLDPAALAQLTVDRARDLLGVDGATLYWWDPDAGLLRRLAGEVLDERWSAQTLGPGERSPGLAFQRCEPIVVQDYRTWEHALPWASERGLQAFAAVPILVGDRPVGALRVFTFTPHHFAPEQVQLLTLFAAQVGPALEAARLYAESERRRAEAEALAELARQGAAEPDADRVINLITEQACHLLGADYAAVALADADGVHTWRGIQGSRSDAWSSPPTQMPLGKGTAGRTLAAGRTLILEHLGDNPELPIDEFPRHRSEGGRTALGTPLFGRGGALGVLVLGWRTDVSVTTAQVRLAEALASYAATILDNAQAHADLAAHAEKLRRLAEIAGAVTADADLPAVLSQIVEAAALAVGLEQNSLLLLDEDDQRLHHAAAVGLPAEYVAAIDGFAIGPAAASCGTAAWRGETVVTEDLHTDPAWEAWRHLATPHGLRAVWSVPLLGKGGRVLGTFAAYRPRPGRPTPQQQELLTLYAHLAAVAVENARSYAREEHLAREAAARAAELAAVFEQLPSGAVVFDAEGQRVLLNEAVRRLWGTPGPGDQPLAERVRLYQLRDPASGRPLEFEELPVARALAGETVQAHEYLLRRPGTTEDIWVHASAVPLRDPDGRVTGAVGLFSDVTRERTLMRELAASEERLRTLYQAMACGVFVSNAAGEIADANEAAEAIFGLTLDQMRGRTPAALWPASREDESELPDNERPSQIALRAGAPVRQETISVRRPTGERRWIQVDAVPVLGPDGAPMQVVSSFIDVTERKRAEQEYARLAAEVERERATLATIMASMNDGLMVLDAMGQIRYYNDQALVLLGMPPQELLGQSVEEAFTLNREVFADPEAAWAALEQGVARVAERPSYEVSLVGPPPRDLLTQLFPVAHIAGSGPAVGVLLRDVTTSKLLALLEERERIAMDLHDGVIQSLYAVALGLTAHERALQPAAAQTREPLRQARAQINAVIQEIRNYIFDLRPHELAARGLRAGLEGLAEELRINALVRPEVAVDAAADNLLGPDAAANVLQIVREATANVIRHAGASAVQISLERTDGRLVLTVSDNGCGFTPPNVGSEGWLAPSAGAGQGLRNMAERARSLGGALDVQSGPGWGTRVRLEVPVAVPRGDACTPAP